MQLCMAHLLVVFDFRYLQNSASGFESTVIFCTKTMFLNHRLPSFEDIGNWRPPNAAPCKAALFSYHAVNTLINIGDLIGQFA